MLLAVCLALPLASSPPPIDASAAPLLTSVIAAGAAVDKRVDVLSSEDVRRAMDVEATQRLMGCDAKSQSCLAELAAAMGAGLVVVGQGGRLGDTLVFSVDLFDSEHATSGGRSLIRGASVDELSTKVEDAAHKLVADYLTTHARPDKAPPIKVLVLDAKLSNVDPAGTSSASSGVPWLAVAGGALAAVGVAGIVVGALFDANAVSEKTLARSSTTQQAADVHTTNGNDAAIGAVVGYGAGALGVVAGAVLGVVGALE